MATESFGARSVSRKSFEGKTCIHRRYDSYSVDGGTYTRGKKKYKRIIWKCSNCHGTIGEYSVQVA